MEFNVFSYIFFGVLIVLFKILFVRKNLISLNPFDNFFMINILIYFSTIFFIYDDIENYFSLLNYILFSAFSLVFGAFFANIILKFKKKDEYRYKQKKFIDDIIKRRIPIIITIIILSTIGSVLAINAQGGIVPLLAIKALLINGQEEAARIYIDSRINISQGKTYFAPGFVAQLKDYITPLLCVIIYFKYRITKKKSFKRLFIITLIITFFGLLSSGTRSGLVIFLFGFLISISSNLVGSNFFPKNKAIKIGIVVLIFMSALTFLMGRTESADSGISSVILDGSFKVIERISAITARENIVIYDKFLRNAGPDFLHDWLLTLSTVLPGKQVPMSIYFAKIVGYSRGNVPLHYWTGLLYNFGNFGIIVAFIWGALLQSYYINFLRINKTILNYTVFSLSSVYLGFAIDPAGLLLYGFFTTIVIYVLIKYQPKIYL